LFVDIVFLKDKQENSDSVRKIGPERKKNHSHPLSRVVDATLLFWKGMSKGGLFAVCSWSQKPLFGKKHQTPSSSKVIIGLGNLPTGSVINPFFDDKDPWQHTAFVSMHNGVFMPPKQKL